MPKTPLYHYHYVVFNRTFPHKSSAVAKRLSATSFPKMLSPPSNESIHAPSQSLSKRPIGKKRLKKTDNWAFFSSNETFHREQKRLHIKKNVEKSIITEK